MFMQIAIGAIGIGVVLMVGYIVVSQVRGSLTTGNIQYQNATGQLVSASADIATSLSSTQATVFAGFGLVAVGIIVLAAFGLINVFK